jgi:hypothetical protein
VKEVVVACLWYCWDICLEGLRKTTKRRNHDSQCPDRDSNIAHPECKPEALLRVFELTCVVQSLSTLLERLELQLLQYDGRDTYIGPTGNINCSDLEVIGLEILKQCRIPVF